MLELPLPHSKTLPTKTSTHRGEAPLADGAHRIENREQKTRVTSGDVTVSGTDERAERTSECTLTEHAND